MKGSAWATKTSQYDLAGRRTRLTWQDGFYVTYEYDAADEMTAIRENGSLALATFVYDDEGSGIGIDRDDGRGAAVDAAGGMVRAGEARQQRHRHAASSDLVGASQERRCSINSSVGPIAAR